MKVVVVANLRWECYSPSLYKLLCPPEVPVYLVFSGAQWFLQGAGHIVTVPDRDTGAMMLANALNRQAAGNGA